MADPHALAALSEILKSIEAMVQVFQDRLNNAFWQDMSPIAAPEPSRTPLAPNHREGYATCFETSMTLLRSPMALISSRTLDLEDPHPSLSPPPCL
jgi:hypothetical protein